jgi:putative NADH-flavin reductase
MKTTVAAMNSSAVTRLIVLSAHGVLETHDRSLYSRAVWAAVGEKMKDKEAMEPVITNSALHWTIVRPPTLRNTPATGSFEHGEDLQIRVWSSISRADLARFLVREAEDPKYVYKYPRIRR